MWRVTRTLLGLALAAAVVLPAAAQTGSAEAGVQFRNLNAASSRFEQYRSLPETFVFTDLGFQLDRSLYLDIAGRNLGLNDQDAALAFGKYGLWKVDAGWNQIIRRYTSNAQSLFGTTGDGRFFIADPVQATAQGYILPNRSLDNVPAAAALFQSLYGATPWQGLQTVRHLGTLSATCTALRGWTFQLGLRNEDRDGEFPLINGFYDRYNTAAGDHNRNFNVELPAPIQFNTRDLRASVAYDQKWFGVSLAYDDSRFRNDVHAIYWDNPWRLASDPSASGVISGSSRGFLDFYPDNDANAFTAQFHVNLPFNTRIMGGTVWGKMTQNQPFLPFSVNPSLRNGATGLYATDPALLPAPSARAEVTTRSQDFEITSTPIQPLTLHARYESYDYNNHTPELVMPGTATYGDSFWATNWGGNPIESHPSAYRRDRKSFDLTWRIAKGYRVALGIEREEWERDLRRVAQTRENFRWIKLAMNPVDWFEMRAAYVWQEHRFDGAYESHHEYQALRNFDVANRDTRRWSLDLSFYPTSGLDMDLYANDTRNDFVDTSYGLQYDKTYEYGAGVTYSQKRWTLYGALSRSRNSTFLQSLSKSDLNGSGGYNTRNTWFSALEDTVDVASIGFTVDLVPRKASLEFYYAYQQGRGTRSDSNVAGILVDNAQAFVFPDTLDRSHLVEGKFTYALNDHWGLGARLLYDSFHLDDYAWNDYGPYNANLNTARFQIHPQFLMNAKYGSYDAVVATLFARYRF